MALALPVGLGLVAASAYVAIRHRGRKITVLEALRDEELASLDPTANAVEDWFVSQVEGIATELLGRAADLVRERRMEIAEALRRIDDRIAAPETIEQGALVATLDRLVAYGQAIASQLTMLRPASSGELHG